MRAVTGFSEWVVVYSEVCSRFEGLRVQDSRQFGGWLEAGDV